MWIFVHQHQASPGPHEWTDRSRQREVREVLGGAEGTRGTRSMATSETLVGGDWNMTFIVIYSDLE